MVTVAQLPQALQTIKTLQGTLNDIRLLLQQAQDLSSNSWQVDIGSRFPLVMTITPAQQAGMVNLYDTLKANLVTTFSQLP